MSKIEITYNGQYPNLCSGTLIVQIDEKIWEFPAGCLISGGSVWFNEDWEAQIEYGEWEIDKWPDEFPENEKENVLNAINQEVPYGCCGGCI